MKNRWNKCDINRAKPWHGNKCTKYKICHSTMIDICIKQDLSKSLSLINEKVRRHWGWVEKALLIKKRCTSEELCIFLNAESFMINKLKLSETNF